jgi:hypothetical protein
MSCLSCETEAIKGVKCPGCETVQFCFKCYLKKKSQFKGKEPKLSIVCISCSKKTYKCPMCLDELRVKNPFYFNGVSEKWLLKICPECYNKRSECLI